LKHKSLAFKLTLSEAAVNTKKAGNAGIPKWPYFMSILENGTDFVIWPSVSRQRF